MTWIIKQVAKHDSLKRYNIYMYYLGQPLFQMAYILFSCQDSSIMSMSQVHHFISKFLKADKLLSFGWITQVCLNKCFLCVHFLWLGFLPWWNTFNEFEKIMMVKILYIMRWILVQGLRLQLYSSTLHKFSVVGSSNFILTLSKININFSFSMIYGTSNNV